MVNYFDLLDKPYKEGERGPDAFDCYGMVREMFYRDWGVIVADYPTHLTSSANLQEMESAASTEWIKLPKRSARCAVTFLLGQHVHIGYMLDENEFIHTIRKLGPGVNSVQGISWRDRITGYYQWKANLENFCI